MENGVLKIGENNYVIAGETNDDSGDVICNLHSWKNDYWVFEITMEDTTTVTNFVGDGGFGVYPNPAGDYVVFTLSGPLTPPLVPPGGGKPTAQIQIFDVFGREVLCKPVVSEKTVFDLRGMRNGIYFYRLEGGGMIYTGKVVIQK